MLSGRQSVRYAIIRTMSSHARDSRMTSNIKELPEYKKYIVLLIDEMKIKESLVYDKIGMKVIGFVDLGSFNNQLVQFEESCNTPPIASHMWNLHEI